MTDFNRTDHAHERKTSPANNPYQPALNQDSSLWGNTVVAILWLGILLLMGCSPLSTPVPGQTKDEGSGVPVSEEATSTAEPAVAGDDLSEDAVENVRIGDTLADLDLSPVSGEPEIGEITFALGVTDNYEPVNPGFLFAQGITEIHAVFDYSGMAGKTWERVWYLNEREISRSSDSWSGPDSGVFDYFIDNGGEPLPAGDWILEIYVDGDLRSLGVFIIEGSQPE